MVTTTYIDFDQRPDAVTVVTKATDLMVAPGVYDTRRCAELEHMLGKRTVSRLVIRQLDELFPHVHEPHVLSADVQRWLADIGAIVGHVVNDVSTMDGTTATVVR